MDSSTISSQDEKRNSVKTGLASRSTSRLNFVEQYLAKRVRQRQWAGGAGVALLALYVGYAMLTFGHGG